MKVLHVVSAFPRHDADLITPWLGRLLLSLKGRGAEVEVLAPSYRGGGATTWRGISVRRFRYAPARLETLTHDETAPDRLRANPAYAALLPGYMIGGSLAAIRAGTRRPDIVHVHWPVPHAWFGALVRAASGGTAALVSSFYSVEIRWVERRLTWALPFLRWSIESADAVTAISSPTSEAVRRYTDRPVPIIPFSAAVSSPVPPPASDPEPAAAVAPRPSTVTLAAPPFASDPPAAATVAPRPSSIVARTAPAAVSSSAPGRASGPAAASPFRVLFVGRLVERKGVEVLIRALALVRDRLDATLTVVGEGRLAGALAAEAARCGVAEITRFPGRIDDRALAEAYASSEVFVLPAVIDRKGDTEGLGVVLLEAMEYGLPVIASRAGGITDIVRDGETGLLVPPGDATSLAEAILQVAEAPTAARERAERAYVHARERFGLRAVTDRLVRCYESAIRARRA